MSKTHPRIIVTETADEFVRKAAATIRDSIVAAIQRRGECRLALSGGSTPAAIHRMLTELAPENAPDWENVVFFFGDERCVPPDHADSNFRMAQETLFQPLSHRIASHQIHRMEAEREDREQAAAEYAEMLVDPLDVLILGMGEDGHTCSLFPGSPLLSETRRCVLIEDSPKPPPARLTITPPVIEDAREIVVTAKGAAKAEVLKKALEKSVPTEAIPIGLARHGIWIVDQPAVSLLSSLE